MSPVRFWLSAPPLVVEIERAEVAQLVEHHLAKVRVAGSSPVFRSIFLSVMTGRAPASRQRAKASQDRPVPLRLVVGQRTLDPLAEVRILEGQPRRNP